MNDDVDEVERVERFLRHGFRAPRSRTLAARYLVERLPAGNYLLNGAGEDSAALLDALAGQQAIRFVAVVDRRATIRERWRGLPLLSHVDAALRYELPIVLMHPDFELDMRGDLLAAGVEVSRLVPVYSSDAYAGWALSVAREELAVRLAGLGPASLLLITGGRRQWSVIADELLRGLAGSGVRLFFGREGHYEPADDWAELDARFSVELVDQVIEALQPRVIYLRVSFQFNNQGLAVWLKRRYPGIRLVVEVYDFSLSVDEQDLIGWNLGRETVAVMRAAERFIVREADALVVKNGGEEWRQMTEGWPVTPRAFFPVVSSGYEIPAVVVEGGGEWRMLYANSMPSTAEMQGGGMMPSYDVWGTLSELNGRGLLFDLFNSGHVSATQDWLFAEHMQRSREGLRYHRRIALDELIARMGMYHFGWMVLERQGESGPLIDRIVIPNRFAAFVAGALPVIVEKQWGFVAELVSRFNAGLVIDGADRLRVPELLAAVDYPALRRGMGRLRERLIAENAKTLACLAGWLPVERA